MKDNIHPAYQALDVECSCGHKFQVNSTLSKAGLRIDVCNLCHPFYTGKQKIVDTAGRVERFNSLYGDML